METEVLPNYQNQLPARENNMYDENTWGGLVVMCLKKQTNQHRFVLDVETRRLHPVVFLLDQDVLYQSVLGGTLRAENIRKWLL